MVNTEKILYLNMNIEYSTLATQREISESVINWRLCDLSQEYPFNSSSVLVLNSDFYQSLECLWRTGVTVKPPVRSVIEWFNFSLNSAQIVILPLCWRGHFYLLVAILNPVAPSIQVLESIGGEFAVIPPFTDIFGKVLSSLIQLSFVAPLWQESTDFSICIPTVPRQPLGSNNCGLFSLKYAELILTSPEEFTRKLLNESLHDWFPIETIENMRCDLTERIQYLAVEQRKDGGLMVGRHLDLPLPSPSFVFAQVINHIDPLII